MAFSFVCPAFMCQRQNSWGKVVKLTLCMVIKLFISDFHAKKVHIQSISQQSESGGAKPQIVLKVGGQERKAHGKYK